MSEKISQVRKDGSMKFASLRHAQLVARAAKKAGYNFGVRQEFAGFKVTDLDD